uniref:Uncharacterized protein n=1 Tax=Riptortus pedestris TaxID=329032 RepID=R4WCP7_RIPPE|nr:unknown secreted protein [Riptortus pedestris]
MKLLLALLAVTAVSFADGFYIFKAGDDPIDLLKQLIDGFNSQITKQQFSQIQLPKFSFDYSYLRFGGEGGSIGNFNTLALKGDKQKFEKTETDEFVKFDFDIGVGLKEIKVEYNSYVSIFYLISHSVDVSLSVGEDSIRLAGSITVNKDKTCTAVLSNAGFEDLTDIKLRVAPSGMINSFLQLVASNFVSLFLPKVTSEINYFLSNAYSSPSFQKQFSDFVCIPFTPK